MPVPWPTDRWGRHIPRRLHCPQELLGQRGECPIDLRGITLAQLRSVQQLTQRVCKAGLLELPAGHVANNASTAECWLEWPSINQHHVRGRLIMQIIPESDPCSWVEFIAERPQKPRFFISHNWSAPFRDFMVALQHHADEVGARSREVYWVCLFAINQFRVDVGTHLEGSTFITALRASDSAVLMLDKTASSLTRLWCLLEVYIVLEKHEALLGWEHPSLRILTPMGVLGSAHVSSGPVVEALRSVDSKLGVASQCPDRRQILNYIAGADETFGLILEDGQLKQPKELDPTVPVEEYEQTLIEANHETFDTFNAKIHDWASRQQENLQLSRSSASPTKDHSNFIADVAGQLDKADKGLSLAQIRTVWRRLKHECVNWRRIGRDVDSDDAGEPRRSGDDCSFRITLFDFVWECLKKDQDCEMCESYMQHFMRQMPGGIVPQEPEYFVNVGFSTPMYEMMAAIEWHAEARALPDSTVYWAWWFALSQQDLRDWFDKRDGTTPTDVVLNKVPKLEGIVLVVDDDLSAFTRLNPVQTLYRFLFVNGENRPCDICCKTGVLSSYLPFRGVGYQFGSFSLAAAEAMTSFDVTKLVARDEGEERRKRQILAEIAGKVDDASVVVTEETSIHYKNFNFRVRKLGCGPVLRRAAAENDARKIVNVVQLTDVSLTSHEVAGVSGEDPLMVASAKGNLIAMETLIRLQADPNRKDAHGETPLHYAALGGQVHAARLLIRCGARAIFASMFEELPSMVAAQSPARFLGVDTRAVYTFLCEEQTLAERPWTAAKRLSGYAGVPGCVIDVGERESNTAALARDILMAHFRKIDNAGSGRISCEPVTSICSYVGIASCDTVKLMRPHTNEDGELDYGGFMADIFGTTGR